MLNEINWPEGYLPGTTDNFASNEIIVQGITAKDVWNSLINTSVWESYYQNMSDIFFYEKDGPLLKEGTRFRFKTFGFPVEAQVVEFEAPSDGKPGRLAWHGWADGDEDHRLDVIHAWLLENLTFNRVRILTQESQKGKPAKDLFNTEPDIMHQGHQDWIKGLAKTVLMEKEASAKP